MLTIILGPMFSGKTSFLINVYKNNVKNNKNTLVINHALDNRYGNKGLTNHNKETIGCIKMEKLSDIYMILNNPKNAQYNTILINEGQFFKDLYNVIYTLLLSNYNIYVCGLNCDSNMEKFGTILDIIPLADDILKLKSTCKLCSKTASFTKRLIHSKEKIIIGHSNIYIPVCRNCFFK